MKKKLLLFSIISVIAVSNCVFSCGPDCLDTGNLNFWNMKLAGKDGDFYLNPASFQDDLYTERNGRVI